MTEWSGFFDGTEQVPVDYTRAELAAIYARYLGNGYIPSLLNKLVVYQPAGNDANMSVNVASGGAQIEGVAYTNDAVKNLTIEAADVTHNRIDRIVLRLTTTGSPGQIRLAVVKGQAANPPVVPTRTWSTPTFELCIAYITVAVGTSAITNAMITSERDDDSVCGAARPDAVGKKAYANVDMNGFKQTGLALGVAATDSASMQNIANTKIDDLTQGDDNTDLDFSTSRHGLTPKGPGLGKFLRDDSTWQAVAVFKTASASDVLQKSVDTERVTTSGPFFLLANIYIPGNYNWGSVFRIRFDVKGNLGGSGYTAIGQLYFNGVAVGSELSDGTAAYVTKTQDLGLGPGLLQLWGRSSAPGYAAYFRNFRVYCTDTTVAPAW
jgi:hypothetical protein